MKKYLSVLLAVSFLFVIAWICMSVNKKTDAPYFSLYNKQSLTTEQIKCWKNKDGEYYVFLPSYAELKYLTIHLPNDMCIRGDDITLTSGMNCANVELHRQYVYAYADSGEAHESGITFLKSDCIPTVYVNTLSGGMDYIHSDKDHKESGFLRIYTQEGILHFDGAATAIGGHGNSTWEEYEKKQYNITLQSNSDLLDMGSAQRWILLANAADTSHMRNKIVFDFSESIGLKYAPDSEWVDLYLNGEYAGLYLLCERNEVNSERIDIGAESYLISQELESRLSGQNIPYIVTSNEVTLRVRYPLNASVSEQEKILQIFQSAENAMIHDVDSNTGQPVEQLIDMDSWTRKYLVEEVFGNMDASYISQYFYIDSNTHSNLIYAGPVWDYDLSLGNTTCWQLSSPYTLLANRKEVRAGTNTPWFYHLYQSELFRNNVENLFVREIQPAIADLLHNKVNTYVYKIEKAAIMNQIRWPVCHSDFYSEISYIRNFLTLRTAFLSQLWVEKKPHYIVCADYTCGTNYMYIAVPAGTCLTGLPVLEDTEHIFAGWYYADTDEPFDITKPITEDTEVYARWETKPSQRLVQIGKILPLAIIAVTGVCLLLIDVRKSNRSR